MPNWSKKCQIGLKIQIAESQLKVPECFGHQERWFVQGWNDVGRGKQRLRVRMAVLRLA